MRIASTVPRTNTPTLTSRRLASESTRAAEVARIGVISGATSIAPMITATLLATRPRVAINVDSTMSTTKRHRNGPNSRPSKNSSSRTARRSSSLIVPRRAAPRVMAPSGVIAGFSPRPGSGPWADTA